MPAAGTGTIFERNPSSGYVIVASRSENGILFPEKATRPGPTTCATKLLFGPEWLEVGFWRSGLIIGL